MSKIIIPLQWIFSPYGDFGPLALFSFFVYNLDKGQIEIV